MMRVLIPIGCRSDAGLVAPIIRRLKQDPAFEVMQYDLKPMDFIESYRITVDKINEFHPSIFFANADRVEMCGATAAAFHNKVKIAHYQGGVINDPKTTFDDTDRDVISLWADIHFVETLQAGYNVAELKREYISSMPLNPVRELKGAHIHVVGITHLDDLEVDESKVPEEPYDLVLLNYAPFDKWSYSIKKERLSIQIGGNPDGKMSIKGDINYPNLPRPQFLGLLKNCTTFITNSSCAITEAPYFLKPEQIVMVGDRNRNRPAVECKPGGSDRIVNILKQLTEVKK
jgi:UDP-N-acetylglucosamine 2-epimerase